MTNEKQLIDVNAIPESATTLSTDGRLYIAWSEIIKAPTVDAVEVVHGEWIADEDGVDEDGNGQYYCSVCGVGEKHNPTVTVSYCWNCGAKMDGGINK